MKKLGLLLMGLLLGATLAHAQTLKVSGTVTGAEDGMPLPGVSVVVKGTTTGTATDMDGKYTLSVPADAQALVFSYIGYATQEVSLAGRSNNVTIDVALESEAVDAGEVMVVAYGVAKKESFTGSAESISAEKLEKRTVANVTKALDGMAPGVMSTSGGGQPGASSNIQIRGYSTINAGTSPLYVVDGIPYDGAMNAINPADIESMTILKDASAGALYGSRAANGVIVITTKKGAKKGGEMKVNFKGNWGVSSQAIANYEVLNQREWLEYTFEAYRNTAIANQGAMSDADAGKTAVRNMLGANIFGKNEQYNPFNYAAYDLFDYSTGKIKADAVSKWDDNWLDEIKAKAPFRHEYVLSVTGGSDMAKYMASVGYLNEEGLLKTTGFDRFSARLNVDTEPKKWLKFGVNAAFSRTTSNYLGSTGSSTSNVWYSAFGMAPIYPIYVRDPKTGEPVLDAQGKKQYDYGENRPSGAQKNFNSYGTLMDDAFRLQRDNLSTRAHLDFLDLKEGALKGLKVSLSLGADYALGHDMAYYNPIHGNYNEKGGMLYKSYERTLSYTFNQMVSYSRDLTDEHHLDVLASHEYYNYTDNYMEAGKSGFAFPEIYDLAMGSLNEYITSYTKDYRIESYLASLNYNYNERYYLAASFRRDGSSVFHQNSRYGNFWSVGVNWRVSNEAFMQDVDWLNNMAVRASYGTVGNDYMFYTNSANRDYYPYMSLYDLGWTNAGKPGAIASSLPKEDLRWESSNSLNIGLDMRMFDRLSVGIEWYLRNTNDMLLSYPLPVSSGFRETIRNIGSMSSSGIEATIAGDILRTDDLRWTLTLMASTTNSKVKKLANSDEFTTGNFIYKVGAPILSFYLPTAAGVDPATGKQLYWVWDTDADGNKGERYLSDNRTKAQACREIHGSRAPKLFGSIRNDLTFKGIDFATLFTYSIGGKVLDAKYNDLMYPLYPGNAISTHTKRSWKKPGDVTDIPAPIVGSGDHIANSGELVDASYFAIKTISLGYTLPSNIAQSINMSTVRVSLTADNICVFTHLKGMDPQFNFRGTTDYTYTPVRTFSLGVDLTF